MTGRGIAAIASHAVRNDAATRRADSRSGENSVTSAPAANARSLPVITTAFTDASAASACARFARAARSAAESALSGGRSRVSSATPSSTTSLTPCSSSAPSSLATIAEATRGRARAGSRHRRVGSRRRPPRAATPRCPARPGPIPACLPEADPTPAAASARPSPRAPRRFVDLERDLPAPGDAAAEHDDPATVGTSRTRARPAGSATRVARAGGRRARPARRDRPNLLRREMATSTASCVAARTPSRSQIQVTNPADIGMLNSPRDARVDLGLRDRARERERAGEPHQRVERTRERRQHVHRAVGLGEPAVRGLVEHHGQRVNHSRP